MMLTVKELLTCIEQAKKKGFCDDESLVVINVNGHCRYAEVTVVDPDRADDLFISHGPRPNGEGIAEEIAELLGTPSDECEWGTIPGQGCGRRPVVATCHECTEALCEQHAVRCLRCDKWFCQDCCHQKDEGAWLCKECSDNK
jgi:hypothetical protein